MSDTHTPPPDHSAPPAAYLVTPRYLAGPDETVQVLGHGWQARPFRNTQTYVHHSEDQLVEAHRNPAPGDWDGKAPRTTTGQERVTDWEFAARPAPGAPLTWRVRFAPTTPPELPAALARAITRPPTMPGPLIFAEPTAPLAAAAWICDRGRDETTWYSLEGRGVVIIRHTNGNGPPPRTVTASGGETTEPEQHSDYWLFAARYESEERLLWFALAEAAVPEELLHALCREISSTEPVSRSEVPGPDTGPVLVHRLR